MVILIKKVVSEYLSVTNIIFLILLLITIVLSSWPILNGNIDFHTDIARDFLLLEDVYYNQNITLIGPRSGGIPGVFHGPAWLYINLPAFIIGQGDPLVVGYFWILLFIISIGIVYVTSKKIYGNVTANWSSLLYASVTGVSLFALFNPFGAVALFPIFFYYLWKYFKSSRVIDLLVTILTVGFIIQFQMAFGGPLFVIIIPLVILKIWKTKTYRHLLAFLIILLPLSSFILFELRHNFLQVRSVITYLSSDDVVGKADISLIENFGIRADIIFRDVLGFFTTDKLWLSFLLFGIFGTVFTRKLKENITLHNPYLLFLYIYVGFWIVTLPYKGTMWGYYYWPFISVLSIMIASINKFINKRLFYLLIITLIFLNMSRLNGLKYRATESNGTWKFYKNLAQDVFKNAPEEFGYYIFNLDRFGYSTRYAMNYLDRQNENKLAFPYEKKPTTFLIIDDPGDNIIINSSGWKLHDVKIATSPASVIPIKGTHWIERYELTPDQVKEPSNPNLLNTLIFR